MNIPVYLAGLEVLKVTILYESRLRPRLWVPGSGFVVNLVKM
jgi:hypothetical protein